MPNVAMVALCHVFPYQRILFLQYLQRLILSVWVVYKSTYLERALMFMDITILLLSKQYFYPSNQPHLVHNIAWCLHLCLYNFNSSFYVYKILFMKYLVFTARLLRTTLVKWCVLVMYDEELRFSQKLVPRESSF